MTGLWKLHVNVTEILLDKKIIKTSLTSIKNTKKNKHILNLLHKAEVLSVPNFPLDLHFTFKNGITCIRISNKKLVRILSHVSSSNEPLAILYLAPPFSPHFHTSENYRTKYIVKNDNKFMTGEKYDYMYILNLSVYSTLPDLKEV